MIECVRCKADDIDRKFCFEVEVQTAKWELYFFECTDRSVLSLQGAEEICDASLLRREQEAMAGDHGRKGASECGDLNPG